MTNRTTLASLILAGALAATGCSKLGLGPQAKKDTAPRASTGELYQPDPSKPDGPMLQMLRAAQDKDETSFVSSFAPDADPMWRNPEVFKKLRQKVLTNKIVPVPDSTQQISPTEAVVKLRDGRGKEIPIRVKKYDDKWLITSIDVGPRAAQKLQQPAKAS
jgi:hypothetical protein